MNFNTEAFQKLTAIVGENYIFTDAETLLHFGHDETEDLSFPPQVVIKPANTQEISEILKVANQYKIPTTPIGARTGLSGGSLSIYGGIGLSLERLNKILQIDENNLQVIVEPAIITQLLC